MAVMLRWGIGVVEITNIPPSTCRTLFGNETGPYNAALFLLVMDLKKIKT
jgi:hypothetical protein